MSRDDELRQLLQRVERDPGNGPLATELLRELHRGYPVESLRVLTSSDDEDVVKTGVWLASELGSRCRPILSDIEALLYHECTYVRYFAVDCMLSTLRAGDGEVVSRVLRLMEDESPAVRRKVMDFAARIPIARLEEILAAAEGSDLSDDHVAGIQLLTSLTSPDRIETFLLDSNPIRCRYGAAAAARVFNEWPQFLQLAVRSGDDDLRIFASDVMSLARPQKPGATGSGEDSGPSHSS